MVARDPGEAQRPSPEALLAAAAREERSRFRLFVGAAPGVGKTYAMLQAAGDRRSEGGDIVVGVVETHGRAETEALLEGLEVLPRRQVLYRGQVLLEMDLDGILARRPAIVLVDELAHSNAPGSRHPKRYLDVEELLGSGIEVWSTVNIQHLESLNDVVAQVTGVRVRETVPDGILDRADEVRLIDLSPEELLERLRDGKVYIPEQAERALEHFFRPAQLAALRQLALRETAEHVDEQMEVQRRARADAAVWPVAERIVVAIDGGPRSESLLRNARRVAERRSVSWTAVFVEPLRFDLRPEAERERVARMLELARQLGGEAVTLSGQDVAAELLHYAQEVNASEIVMGRPARTGWRRWLRRSPAAEVVRRCGPIEVRLVEGAETQGARASRALRGRPIRPGGYLLALAAVAGGALAAAGLMAVLPLPDPGMVFLIAVLVTAVAGGLGPSIAASILAVVIYDFFFVAPYHTLSVTSPQDVIAIAVFLTTAVLTSHLTARVREQAEAARRREKRTAALFAFAREIASAARADELVRAIARHFARVFEAQAVLLLPDGGALRMRASHPMELAFSAAERATAHWVLEHGELAGHGTQTLAGSEWLHVPLTTVRGTVGVLALHGSRPDAFLPLDQRQLLGALADQAAVAIERTRIDAVLEEKAKTEAVIESIDDGLIVLDPQGVVAGINEIACAILEVERRDALGRPFRTLGTSHPHYLRLRAAVGDFLAHPERAPEALEIAMFLRGRDHFFVLRPTPLRGADGAAIGLILALQDVTYLRDQEARREQLMATLSHELRTPITSLRMAGDLLARSDPPLPEKAHALVEAAREDVARLEGVAHRLLELSQSRAMSIALERGPVSIAELIGRMARVFALQAGQQGVSLETSVSEGDLSIAGDSTKLTWALSNLIGNALRYTPHGGTIRVAATAVGGGVRLSVADTGPGIPPDRRERIFERHVQGDEPGAAGLGLAIVRDVVQAHGGRIFLESEVGRGSRFILDLPREPTAPG